MVEFQKNPNPTKDQHFMVDKNMLERIYDTADIKPGESIVEIGGGEGALTDYLASGQNYVTVIEKDPYYAAYLRNKYAGFSNVQVVEGDALNFDFTGYDRVVANLPYTITEPFLINLARSGALDYNPSNPKGSKVKSVTLVLSQNSTRKMVAPVQETEGKSRHACQEFGIMSAICKAYSDVDVVCAIPSSAFFPEPAVTSFVVNLTPKKNKTVVDRIMREILTDKKGNRPTVGRIYQLMLAQDKIYKINKHKGSNSAASNPNFTSKTILNQNVYDLSNSHISQLVQDLIRNDVNIKSRNHSASRNGRYAEDDISAYFVGGRFVMPSYEDDSDDYDYEEEVVTSKSKFEAKYDYMYDDTQYKALLHRGLEFLDEDELHILLGNLHKVQPDALKRALK